MLLILYYAHQVDPNVPVEDTIGAMSDLVKEGKVRYLGLSEASSNSILRANAIHSIAAVQSEYSLLSRDVERDILPLCKQLGISLISFSPLARGLVTNTIDVHKLTIDDFRNTLPRYQGEYAINNMNLAQSFATLAEKKKCTLAQLALA